MRPFCGRLFIYHVIITVSVTLPTGWGHKYRSLHCFAARELKGICHTQTHTPAGNLSHTHTCLQALSVTHTEADKSKFLTSHTNEASTRR